MSSIGKKEKEMKKEKPKDLKESLTSSRKPDITHLRGPFLNYGARASEFGSVKYSRANYARPTDSLKEDFERLRSYLRACISHVITTLDEMEYHQAMDPNLEDEEGMKIAAFAEDTDAKPGCPVGPSGLPHLCGAVASLNLAITQATQAGLLPKDPGRPWEDKKVEEEAKYTSVMVLEGTLANGTMRPLDQVQNNTVCQMCSNDPYDCEWCDKVVEKKAATTEEEAVAMLDEKSKPFNFGA